MESAKPSRLTTARIRSSLPSAKIAWWALRAPCVTSMRGRRFMYRIGLRKPAMRRRAARLQQRRSQRRGRMVAAIDQIAVGSNNLNAQLGAVVPCPRLEQAAVPGGSAFGVILWRQRNFGNRMRRDHRRQILCPRSGSHPQRALTATKRRRTSGRSSDESPCRNAVTWPCRREYRYCQTETSEASVQSNEFVLFTSPEVASVWIEIAAPIRGPRIADIRVTVACRSRCTVMEKGTLKSDESGRFITDLEPGHPVSVLVVVADLVGGRHARGAESWVTLLQISDGFSMRCAHRACHSASGGTAACKT